MNKQHPIAGRRGPVFWNNVILRLSRQWAAQLHGGNWGDAVFQGIPPGKFGTRRAQFNKKERRADAFPIYEIRSRALCP
jgi:hypothetical protein